MIFTLNITHCLNFVLLFHISKCFSSFFVGSRFALMEVKAIAFYILSDFILKPYDKTQIPVKIENSAANWIADVNLEFVPRNSSAQ